MIPAPLRPRLVSATRHSILVAVLVAAATLAGTLVAAPAAAAPRLQQGERIEVTGLVTGPDGKPIENVQVVLELVREAFDFRSFRRTRQQVTPVAATTDAGGEYTIAFPWDTFYNRFELVVGVPVRGRGGEELLELERVDLTPRIAKGTPVVATVVVQNAAFVRNFRQFLGTVDTDDERRVYQQEGRPDRVKVTKYPDHTETAWWYFAAGHVYRFIDGTLRANETFDPVRGFQDSR